MRTYEVEIWKIDAHAERTSADAFLSNTFDNAREAGDWIYNDINHPVIDCAGFELVVNGEVINSYIYRKGWQYPNDAESKAVDTI